jgi:hypothetical protein
MSGSPFVVVFAVFTVFAVFATFVVLLRGPDGAKGPSTS